MNKDLEQKIIDYYTKYYKKDCSLPNYEKRVARRLKEEENELKRIERLSKLGLNFNNKKICIIGAGTGGLAVALKQVYQNNTYGIEPNKDGLSIIKDKCLLNDIPPENFKLEGSEKILFADNSFDLIYCFTVLEHVNDINKSIDEMIRITKPTGKIYINTPNYAFPYEGHYKIPMPTFLPKTLCYVYLIILGKSPSFLKTINFITEKSLNKILIKKINISWIRIYEPLSKHKGKLSFILNFFQFQLSTYPNQEVIIIKQ